MTQGLYPSIEHGLGNLTPDMWHRLMLMLQHFESKVRDERGSDDEPAVSFFLAKLTGAKNVKASSNIYKYKWTKVKISGVHANGYLEFEDTTTTSTVDGDDYAKGAWNIIESVNTTTLTSTGVDESLSGFPSGFHLQAIGGGYHDSLGSDVTQYVNTIVLMWSTQSKYIFSSSNSYDGTC